jgi:glutaredoxin 3
MTVEIFSIPNCPYCVNAKLLCENLGLDYTVTNVRDGTQEEQDAAKAALIERVGAASGKPPRTMPQIFVDGEYVGGFDQLNAMMRNR